MKKFIQQLQRRNVIKATLSYVVISWAILQGGDIIFPILHLGTNAMEILLVVLLICFPIWVIFAYVYELTPTGFKKTDEVKPESSIHQSTSKRLNAYIISGLAIAVLLLVIDRVFNFSGDMKESIQDKSIAVLPFSNMSREGDAYFAEGMTEDILTQIGKIGAIRVLSRQATRDYDITGKTPKQIGDELNVSFLLMGSVRRAKNDLRIACQLIDVSTDEETWAHTFDRKMDDLFAIQSEVAKKIASMLYVELSDPVIQRIEHWPTDNLVAYNYYLRGKMVKLDHTPESLKKRIDLYEASIREDSTFALPWAGLAITYIVAISNYGSLSRDYIDTAFLKAKKAILLDPKTVETWSALGTIYMHKNENDLAETQFQEALKINPNNAWVMAQLASIYDDRGETAEAIGMQKKVVALNPLNSDHHVNLGFYYNSIGLYPQAIEALETAAQLNPKNLWSWYNLSLAYLGMGEVDKAIMSTEELVNIDPGSAWILEVAGDVARYYDLKTSRNYFERSYFAEDYDPELNWWTPVGLGYALWQEGNLDSANYFFDRTLALFSTSIKSGKADDNQLYISAAIHSIRGDLASPLEYVMENFGNVVGHWKTLDDPWLENLRLELVFIETIDAMKVNEERFRNQVLKMEKEADPK